jgi:hypothetical protein
MLGLPVAVGKVVASAIGMAIALAVTGALRTEDSATLRGAITEA